MNERIRELAEQAGFNPDLNWDHTDWHAAGYSDLFEKFAELIVRECIEQLEIGKRCDPYTGELFVCERNADIDYEIAVLKEHFGVGE